MSDRNAVTNTESPSAAPFFPIITPHTATNGINSTIRPIDMRRNNASLVFSTLFPDRQLSRADIARATGLSRVVVSEAAATLISKGFIREVGPQPSSGKGPGKRGTLLGTNPERLRLLSIDLSQPHLIQGAILNLFGQTITRAEITLGASDQFTVSDVDDLIAQLLRSGQHPVGIGIAAPGVVKNESNVLSYTYSQWHNTDLREPIEQKFGIPTTVNNDAASALMAERCFGQGGPNLLFIQLARGVGSALLINDMRVAGSNYAVGEIGHIPVRQDGPQCSCGRHGCLDAIIGTPVLRARMQGHPSDCERIIAQAGRDLAAALSMPVAMLDIDDICVYGPSDIVNDTFISAAQQQLTRDTTSVLHPRTVIRRCQIGGDIVIRGELIPILQMSLSRL
ncbi:ROK family transcriptional regulator [Bifidobacterium felsineum]|uniref:ROK family transcriptional regulator n=1 Tax=Bifidobacterium felsineum TaxID=2045440 RepID=UPI001BDD1DC2|nr:ROK family transcriptional regulator [Bifidobacterium felsineum]MBT1163067.1 ROK family transcriptional regulator [Bifidobacterium felsineum]